MDIDMVVGAAEALRGDDGVAEAALKLGKI